MVGLMCNYLYVMWKVMKMAVLPKPKKPDRKTVEFSYSSEQCDQKLTDRLTGIRKAILVEMAYKTYLKELH